MIVRQHGTGTAVALLSSLLASTSVWAQSTSAAAQVATAALGAPIGTSQGQPPATLNAGGQTSQGGAGANIVPSPASSTTSNIAEIVVTAQKRSESVNRVPLSINVLSSAQLASAGVTSTEGLSRVVPGFSATTSYFGTPVYYLRGVGYYDTSVSARPTVTVYADEALIPYSVMAVGTTLDLQRVEVLKGPQGTLFGSNSTGGAINFIAAKPTSSFESGGDFSYGRFNDGIISGFVSGPVSNYLDGRLAVSHEGAGDWQYNFINGSKLGKKDITSVRGTLALHSVPKLNASLTISGTHDGSDVQGGQLVGLNAAVDSPPQLKAFPLAPGNARATAFGSIYPNGAQLHKDNNEIQGILRIDYDVAENLKITSLTSAAFNHQSFAENAGATTLVDATLDRLGNIATISEELRAAGSYNGNRGHYVAGVSTEADKTNENTSYDLIDNASGNVFDAFGLPPINDVPTLLSTRFDSDAAFLSTDYSILDNVTARAGVRYTATHLAYRDCVVNAGNLAYATGIRAILNLTGSDVPPFGPGTCTTFAPTAAGGDALAPIQGRVDQGNISWRGGLDWRPIPGTLLYGNVSRGYKAAAISNIAAVFTSQTSPVPQERLTAYEIGVKSDVSRFVHVNAALYYYDYKDKQVEGTEDVPVFGPLTRLVSIPISQVEGADLDVTAQPIKGLTLTAQASYVQTRVDGAFTNTNALGSVEDFNGASFANVPKLQAGINGEYRHDVSDRLAAFMGSRFQYRSGTYGDFGKLQALRIEPYGLLDAYAGVATKDNRWSLQVWGRNITNKYYWDSQVSNQDNIVRYVGLPATYGVSGSFHF